MQQDSLKKVAGIAFALVLALGAAWQVQAQDAKTKYPGMAPLDQYLITDPNNEIALARSAAPDSISRDAEVMVLTRHGYEIAVKGKNSFVCLVWRSWTAGIDDPDFWNPKLRAPICLNAPAARFNVPLVNKKTELVLAGRSKAQMFDEIKAAFDKKELAEVEPGAMCFMLSKQGYVSDRDGHWHPHLMFFVLPIEAAAWGANVSGSPVLGGKDAESHFALFLVPVTKWSDGTPAPAYDH